MKILITGGAGFVGSNIVKILEDKGIGTVILDDFSHANFKNLENLKGDLVCGDILDEGIFDKLPQVDGVIHEAAVTDTTLRDDRKMMMVNFTGFQNVLRFCLKKKLKLVYASSAGVYGSGPSPMKENQTPAPLNTYAYSKYMCDVDARKICRQEKTPFIAGVRYFNVYGPGEAHKGVASSMIYHLCRQMKDNLSPRLFKYGEQKRDFIYVKDAARITIEVLISGKQQADLTLLNVGTGKARSFNDIVSGLNKVLNKDLKPDYFDNPYEGLYQNYTEADITALKQKGISAPEFSLEQGIQDYVNSCFL